MQRTKEEDWPINYFPKYVQREAKAFRDIQSKLLPNEDGRNIDLVLV